MNDYKPLFILDREVVYLNHGSFGAVPRAVFEAYQSWQRELEKQPVVFLGRRAPHLLEQARELLAEYLHSAPDEVVYFTNPTSALNMVARNLALRSYGRKGKKGHRFSLQPGDEILATDHEYGALDRTWHYICKLTGARYVNLPIPPPLEEAGSFVERFWAGVNARTRVIFISHITSPTGLIFPIAEICRRARQAGILCIVDGAHAPGQISLNLQAIGADIYAGACHKWLCAPKGSAFLYARREIQDILDPLVVSWGYESEKPSGSQFIDYHEWQGTRDLAAFLSVPAAIEFQAEHDWDLVRRRCHSLALEARNRIEAFTGLPSICAERDFAQMFSICLPDPIDQERLQQQLYDRFKVEVPTVLWNGQKLLRVSIQAYNDEEDVQMLIQSLSELLSAEVK